MTTPKAKLAGLALIAAQCAGFTLGLTAPAWAGWDEGVAAAVNLPLFQGWRRFDSKVGSFVIGMGHLP